MGLDMYTLGDILLSNLKPRKEVMTLKKRGLTKLFVSNEGEPESKLILNITIIYTQNRR